MKLNHNTYVGKKSLYFITYNVLRGLKHPNTLKNAAKLPRCCLA